MAPVKKKHAKNASKLCQSTRITETRDVECKDGTIITWFRMHNVYVSSKSWW